MILLSQKVTHIQQKLQAVQEKAARVGLKVNASQTKEMKIWSTVNTGNIVCAGDVLKWVTDFT